MSARTDTALPIDTALPGSGHSGEATPTPCTRSEMGPSAPMASPRPGTWGAMLRREVGSARASYMPAPAVDQTRGRRPAGEQQDPSLRPA